MAKNEAKVNKEKKHFFKDFKAEIKKVVWLSPKQLINNTTAVIIMVLIVAVIVFVLDLAFDAFNKYALTGLQEVVQTSVENKDSESSEENNSEEGNSEEATGEETAPEADENANTETTEETNASE